MLIVISEDCDVTAIDFDREPLVEVLRASEIQEDQMNGSFTWGKNPRIIHFTDSSTTTSYEVCASDNLRLDRRVLGEAAPGGRLSSNTVHELGIWMAKRYHRAAFPDTFNARIRPILKKLMKCLKKRGNDLSGVYFALVREELDSDVPYDVELFATMPASTYTIPSRRDECQRCLDELVALLGTCPGINLLDASLRSEAEVSVDDLRVLLRWDVDDLSARRDPPGARPPASI